MNARTGFAAAAYRQAAASVHPTVAVVKLYDATLLAIQQAIRAREAKQFEECFVKVMRAATILRGLDHALDYAKGGAVAEQLHRVYRSHILALHMSFGKPDVIRRYGKLHDSLVGLRDAWAHIAGVSPYVATSDGSSEIATAPAEPNMPAAKPTKPASAAEFDGNMFLGLIAAGPAEHAAPVAARPHGRQVRMR